MGTCGSNPLRAIILHLTCLLCQHGNGNAQHPVHDGIGMLGVVSSATGAYAFTFSGLSGRWPGVGSPKSAWCGHGGPYQNQPGAESVLCYQSDVGLSPIVVVPGRLSCCASLQREAELCSNRCFRWPRTLWRESSLAAAGAGCRCAHSVPFAGVAVCAGQAS